MALSKFRALYLIAILALVIQSPSKVMWAYSYGTWPGRSMPCRPSKLRRKASRRIRRQADRDGVKRDALASDARKKHLNASIWRRGGGTGNAVARSNAYSPLRYRFASIRPTTNEMSQTATPTQSWSLVCSSRATSITKNPRMHAVRTHMPVPRRTATYSLGFRSIRPSYHQYSAVELRANVAPPHSTRRHALTFHHASIWRRGGKSGVGEGNPVNLSHRHHCCSQRLLPTSSDDCGKEVVAVGLIGLIFCSSRTW